MIFDFPILIFGTSLIQALTRGMLRRFRFGFFVKTVAVAVDLGVEPTFEATLEQTTMYSVLTANIPP